MSVIRMEGLGVGGGGGRQLLVISSTGRIRI